MRKVERQLRAQHTKGEQELIDLVRRTAKAMRARVLEKERAGRRGWKTRITDLLGRFERACARRDFLDACILAAMLYDFQARNAQRKARKGGA